MQEFLTADEVADRYRIGRSTVRRWCNTGQLKAIKAGKQWRIALPDLEDFLKSKGVQQEPKKANGLAAFAH